jgi:tripartite-type tricarboxylate transporter receptor subunit TctC
LTGLLSGEAQVMVATLGSCLPQIRAGKLRALALGSRKRSALLPQLPTVAESGLPGYEAETWYAVLAARGTPVKYTHVLNRALVASVETPDIQEKLAATGFEPNPSSAAEFAAYLKSEIVKWARAIKAAGIARS